MTPTLKDKIIFITGAGGFIGSAATRALITAGATIRALIGAPQDIVHAFPTGVATIRADITDIDTIYDFATGADIVVHIAGPASVRASFEDPREYVRIHIVGTATVLNVCQKVGIRRFIYISSAEVYGSPRENPVTEDHPLQARSPYAAAKIGAERLTEAFTYFCGLEAVILRPFSIYGPGLSSQSLIGTILRQARENGAIVLADLAPVRDYCHVSDLADAIVRACSVNVPQLYTLNIGSGKGTSVAQLVDSVVKILGRKISVSQAIEGKRPGSAEIYHLIANAQRASKVLGWVPQISLHTGLEQLVALTGY